MVFFVVCVRIILFTMWRAKLKGIGRHCGLPVWPWPAASSAPCSHHVGSASLPHFDWWVPTRLLPLQLFYKNGQPFPAHRPVGLRVHISHVELAVEIPVTQEVLQEPNSNVVKVAFTVRKAGRYEITVKLGGLNVAYSPYYKIFQPGRFLVHSLFLPLLSSLFW